MVSGCFVSEVLFADKSASTVAAQAQKEAGWYYHMLYNTRAAQDSYSCLGEPSAASQSHPMSLIMGWSL